METRKLAKNIRIHAVTMTHLGKSSHIGSVLSIADILAVLYNDVLRINPDHPRGEDRDRFILSKGHAGAGVYAVLAEKGFFSKELLKTHYQNGSLLSGHVSHKGIPGVEISTGSLGHGLSVGAGLALAGKMDRKDWRTFVLLSDGECDEGAVWEAALFSAHFKLDNLIVMIDYNKIQSLASVRETMNLEPFAAKWESFGWAVRSVNGHDPQELRRELKSVPFEASKPSCLIAHTVKGKGVSFMENQVLWHYRSPQGEEFEDALKELNLSPSKP